MCLIGWVWQPESDTPLRLVGNRDEFYARPSQPLHRWTTEGILAGRDLQAGGTWLGVSPSGRLAALTNYRAPLAMRSLTPSRGELVTHFLTGHLDAATFLNALAPRAGDYNPFNLLVFDGQRLMGLESRRAQAFDIAPGVGAVSNADFDTPWPKVVRLKQGLQTLTQTGRSDPASLLQLLQDRRVAPDAELPATGIPLARERALSAAFIASADYGTRACSLIHIGRQRIEFTEHNFDAQGSTGEQHLNVTVHST
jgi:uncharacterized protein with NRDE domain